jgi:hypothetical protein
MYLRRGRAPEMRGDSRLEEMESPVPLTVTVARAAVGYRRRHLQFELGYQELD